MITVISCDKSYNTDKYFEYQKSFNKEFINQFPRKLICSSYNIFSNTNTEKNNVGLLLLEKFSDSKSIIEIRNQISKLAIAKYYSKDNFLLIVNQFETYDSNEKMTMPKIDSLSILRDCEKKKFPIPNFIDFKQENKNNKLHIDDSFELFILESKPNNYFKKFKLQQNPQMCYKWKNGYSKGVAISTKNNEIIYWSILW